MPAKLTDGLAFDLVFHVILHCEGKLSWGWEAECDLCRGLTIYWHFSRTVVSKVLHNVTIEDCIFMGSAYDPHHRTS